MVGHRRKMAGRCISCGATWGQGYPQKQYCQRCKSRLHQQRYRARKRGDSPGP